VKIVGPAVRLNPLAPKRRSRARYAHSRQAPARRFAKGSFRTITLSKRKGVKAVVGCPKGAWNARRKRCRKGTRVVSVLRPKSGRRLNPMPKTRKALEEAVVRSTPHQFRERSGGGWNIWFREQWRPVAKMPIQTLWEMERFYQERCVPKAPAAAPAERQRAPRTPKEPVYYERRARLVLPNPKRRKTAAKVTRRNPVLVIANPGDGLPAHLTGWAKRHRLSPAEWAAFRGACARYHKFHGTYPKTIKRTGNVAGAQNRFLVGMGKTVDVTYHAAGKAFQGSSKRGIPWKHEFPSRPTMAVDPATDTILITNPKGRFVVSDFIRG
jgi:hypothetical protein